MLDTDVIRQTAKEHTMKQKLAKLIRVITIPPVFAALLCTLLYCRVDGAYASAGHYVAALCFLSFLPLLSYPVSAMVPAFRNDRRKAERTLGLIFSVAGYIGGALFVLFTHCTKIETAIYGTYLLSGLSLAVCTALRFKASAHTCGCSGPIAGLSYFISPWFLLGYILLGVVSWASIRLKRHSTMQLIGGSVIPVLALLLCCQWLL